MQSVIYADCHKQALNAQWHYAECIYVQSHYAECCGSIFEITCSELGTVALWTLSITKFALVEGVGLKSCNPLSLNNLTCLGLYYKTYLGCSC